MVQVQERGGRKVVLSCKKRYGWQLCKIWKISSFQNIRITSATNVLTAYQS